MHVDKLLKPFKGEVRICFAQFSGDYLVLLGVLLFPNPVFWRRGSSHMTSPCDLSGIAIKRCGQASTCATMFSDHNTREKPQCGYSAPPLSAILLSTVSVYHPVPSGSRWFSFWTYFSQPKVVSHCLLPFTSFHLIM